MLCGEKAPEGWRTPGRFATARVIASAAASRSAAALRRFRALRGDLLQSHRQPARNIALLDPRSLWQMLKKLATFSGQMGHFCRICQSLRPNEQFTGRGHRDHICKECQRLPRDEQDQMERLDELYGFLQQSNISAKNVARLKSLSQHANKEVADSAALILEIARVLPHKRNRWLKLARRHRPLLDRAIALFGLEFFEDLLSGHGDFESPLWEILRQYQSKLPDKGNASADLAEDAWIDGDDAFPELKDLD
ncbi:MAG TPA: hypothetical protein VF988_08920 [Verrucomicrobiae bacterium]